MVNRTLSGAALALAILPSCFAAAAKPAAWIEVRSPHFVVICNGSEKQARRTAAQFEQFRSVIHTALPKLRVDSANPLTIFAARDENHLKALLPQFWATRGMVHPAGIFQPGMEKNYVALRLDAVGEHVYHTIYHEYTHMIMQLNFPRLPVWLSEGMAEFFGQATLSDKESGIGQPSAEQLGILRESRLLPLAVLLAVDHFSPYYREQDKVGILYAQSWALTHYFMIGDKGAHFQQLAGYLEAIQKGTPDIDATGALGDFQKLEKALEQYIRQMSFYYLKVSATIPAEEKQYPLRTLTQAELLAARGDFFVHTNRLEEAQAALDEAMKVDPESAAVHESMGLLCIREGNHEEAMKHFSTAAGLDSRSFMAHFYAAQAAFEARGEGRLEEAETHLRKTIEINPSFAPAYANLASVLASKDGALEEALQMAGKAAQLEPGVIRHRVNVGRILMNMQRIDDAIRLGERLLAEATSEADRGEADTFLASVRQHKSFLAEQKQREEEQQAVLLEYEKRRAEAEQRRGEAEKAGQKAENPAATEPPPEAAAPVPDAAGPLSAMDGTVRSTSCAFPAVMDLVLDVGGKLFSFRAPDFYAIRYRAAGKPPRSDFQPCTELEGISVRIEYAATPGKDYLGEIKGIRILN